MSQGVDTRLCLPKTAWPPTCLVAPGECDRDTTCTMHAVWEEAQEKMMGVLAKANFADLAKTNGNAEKSDRSHVVL